MKIRRNFLSVGDFCSDLIKNKTLEYLSRSLPFLKEQQNLPKVARFSGPVQVQAGSPTGPIYRFRRSLNDEVVNTSTIRVNNHGVGHSGVSGVGWEHRSQCLAFKN